MTWVDEYHFGEDFDDLRTDPVMAARLARELASELSPGHPLLGQAWTIVAKARPAHLRPRSGPPFVLTQDEVVVTTDSAVYLVTWTTRPARPPGPIARAFQSAAGFEGTIKDRYWPQPFCDWCYGPPTESAWQGSVSLGLDPQDLLGDFRSR